MFDLLLAASGVVLFVIILWNPRTMQPHTYVTVFSKGNERYILCWRADQRREAVDAAWRWVQDERLAFDADDAWELEFEMQIDEVLEKLAAIRTETKS